MPSENPKIYAVEHSLRYKIQIAGDGNRPMTLSERMAHYKVPGVSIAVINKGVLDWAKAYGAVSTSHDANCIDTETLFQAGSISKSLNAIGALLLVQKGVLSLDDDINQYLISWKIPESELTKKEKVTLRRLLSHSAGVSVSGFPGYASDMKVPSIQAILNGKKPEVNTDPICVVCEPGSVFQYSGGGTTIVQLLIEELTGEKYDVWMQRNVLMPLGMHRSTFSQPLPQEDTQNAAHGHQPNACPVKGSWHVYPEMAAAGLWTTPTDLAAFIVEILKIVQHQPGILHPKLLKEAMTPQIQIGEWFSDTISETCGLGFFLAGSAGSLKVGHDGGNAGFIGRYIILPERGQGLVIMVNQDGAFGLIDEITHSIADVYGISGFEFIERPEMEFADIAQYSEFVGKYQHQDDELTISMHDNKLFISFSYSQEMQLHQEKDDLFFAQESSDVVKLIGSHDHENEVHIIANGKETTYTNASVSAKTRPS